jgi:hypothetical protein
MNKIIKIDLVNKKVEFIKEIEEGYIKEIKSRDGYVYDYEEYIIVDMREEG